MAAGLDRHEHKVEQPHAASGEQHLSGARHEVEAHQRAQHGASKGAEKGPHPTHLEMSNPYEKQPAQNGTPEKPGAAKPGDTTKAPAEQTPQSPNSAGSAWDIRNQYNMRNQVGKEFSPTEAGGSDTKQEKPVEPSTSPKWQQRPPEAGDAVTKWNGV